MSWDRRSIFERGAEDLMDQDIERDPRWGPLIVQMRRKLREGYYDQSIVDVIGQRTSRTYTYVDAYIFTRIWCCDWLHGEIGTTFVSAGKAGPDKDIKGNQKTLDIHLHEFFRAFVGGRPLDDAGTLRWIKPITFTRTIGEPDGETQTAIPWICGPWTLPLEIGTTSMARTFGHLLVDGGVARWPYGHDRVTILRAYPAFSDVPGTAEDPEP